MILALVDLFPQLIVAVEHILDALAVGEIGIRIDRLADVDGIFLYKEAVLAHDVGILHGDEARQDGYVVAYRKAVSAVLEGLGLAVVPPHGLLGIDEDEVALLQEHIHALHELLHGAQAGTRYSCPRG